MCLSHCFFGEQTVFWFLCSSIEWVYLAGSVTYHVESFVRKWICLFLGIKWLIWPEPCCIVWFIFVANKAVFVYDLCIYFFRIWLLTCITPKHRKIYWYISVCIFFQATSYIHPGCFQCVINWKFDTKQVKLQ